MSASRIKTYLQCAEKYHQQYENGVKGGAIHLTFGTLVHKVFERYFQEDKDLAELYQEEWDKADIADPEFFRDGFDIVENFRRMNAKDSSPMGFELPFAINIATGHVYDASVVDFENDREGSKAFLKMLEAEDAPIIFGFIDRVDYDMDNDILRIIDYKTSRIPLTQYEADEDVQLSMYALVAKYLFPDYQRVRLELHYVREGVPVVTSRTPEQLDVFQKWLVSIHHKIREDNTHVATLNKYCGWCDAKGNCVAYQDLVNGEADPDFNAEELNYAELDEQLEKLAIHIKILDGRKKEIEALFKKKLKDSDNSPIKTGDGERFVTPNARINYNVNAVMRLFPDSIDELLSVNKTAVDKLAKGNPELIQELVDTGNKYYIAPTLRKKKK
jgi:hypothetical protein